MPTITRPSPVTPAQALAVATALALPALAQGVVVRRPRMVRLAALADADGRAVRLLRRLRAERGDAPLLVPVPGRGQAVLPLASDDVLAVLEDRAFTPATREKRGALAHFQPDGVLITPDHGLRERRRSLNDEVLSADLSAFTGAFARVVEEEAATLPREGMLTWRVFHAAHWRIVRRIVLGDAARNDVTLVRQLHRLRRDANWSSLRGRRTDVRTDFLRRLGGHLARAEPGSLAGALAAARAAGHVGADVHADGQVPHWLFAFDAVAMAVYRALALLAEHPVPLRHDLLRAAVLESLRLWPTTIAILREVAGPTTWDVPEGTLVVIYSPYVNRAEPGSSYRPELWLEGGGAWAGVPFSAGFARCAGEELVLFTATTLLEAILREREISTSAELRGELPGTLDHFHLRFAVKPQTGSVFPCD
ncbi:cytochrome P450 [Nonomuraea aridisoli]|uniref:Cytochrome P450 n=1 Tax=Nonomuraea aridisoli TaxID=2070368 RepID=A0A2W2EXL1_9ACTN|nr:cytochrome P450 [Nonomuraea aridisoli]PZG18300.1 cytochrome P450 [Nonomuraea aridisoli]